MEREENTRVEGEKRTRASKIHIAELNSRVDFSREILAARDVLAEDVGFARGAGAVIAVLECAGDAVGFGGHGCGEERGGEGDEMHIDGAEGG